MKEAQGFQEHMRERGMSLANVVQNLIEESRAFGPKHITGAPREFRIQRSITPDALKDMALLPFEVLLTEHAAGMTLITGSKNAIWGRADTHTADRTRSEARFTLHNHPNSVAASPSDGDIQVSRTSRSDIDLIIAHEGVTIHKADYSLFTSDRGMGTLISRLRGGDHAVRHDIAGGYAQAWIPWGDARIQDICEYLNGKVQWGDIKDRMSVPQQ